MQYHGASYAADVWDTYYFEKNLQGDVVAVYDTNGTKLISYVYDAWGAMGTAYSNGGLNTTATKNPFRYRGYYYDSDLELYYLNSRYYDANTGRFINADDTAYLGADGTSLSYNLFAYCKNNPVMGCDPTGHFGLVGAIIATGAIVGGLLGAFSAATTGGNILESAIEGCLTGALGAACGILISNPVVAVGLATVGGAAIDFTTQVATQYIETKSVDMSKIDRGRIVKTGLQTGIGTAIPAFGEGAGNAVDAFGTALIWAEASTMIICTDVIVTNTIAAVQSLSVSVPKIRHSVAINKREMLLR
jgi:RHS repeat-associated protein